MTSTSDNPNVPSIFIKKNSSSLVNSFLKTLTTQILLEKQSFTDFLQNWHCQTFFKTHRKICAPESHFS